MMRKDVCLLCNLCVMILFKIPLYAMENSEQFGTLQIPMPEQVVTLVTALSEFESNPLARELVRVVWQDEHAELKNKFIYALEKMRYTINTKGEGALSEMQRNALDTLRKFNGNRQYIFNDNEKLLLRRYAVDYLLKDVGKKQTSLNKLRGITACWFFTGGVVGFLLAIAVCDSFLCRCNCDS